MYINKLLKRQLSLSAVTLFLIVFVVFGLSFAVFQKTIADTAVQNMNIGDLNIAFSSSAAIDLSDLDPMTDEDALALTTNNYSFVINNNGSVAYEYVVTLENNSSYLSGGTNYNSSRVLLDHKYIRANLSGTEDSTSFVNQTFALGEKTNGVIYRFVVNPQKSHQFNLKVWVADAETYLLPNEAIGAEVHLNVKIEGWATDENTYAFNYTGSEQTFTAPKAGTYKVELWGASGGGAKGGNGAYTSGMIELSENDNLYLHVGGKGPANETVTNIGGYNGGGYSGNNSGQNSYGGGGATDIRLSTGTWNNATSLNSRIMVSAGGAGTTKNLTTKAGSAGGLTGYNGTTNPGNYNTSTYLPIGSNQTGVGFAYQTTVRQGAFGYAIQSNTGGYGGGGGSGYYGGGNGFGTTGAGGSSYISGHTGCVAIASESSTAARTTASGGTCTTGSTDNVCSIHYSGKIFTNTTMIDGEGYSWTHIKGELTKMPNPNGGVYASGIGHTGDGFARITFIG